MNLPPVHQGGGTISENILQSRVLWSHYHWLHFLAVASDCHLLVGVSLVLLLASYRLLHSYNIAGPSDKVYCIVE